MTTLKYEQQAKIAELANLHTQYVIAKTELRAKVEREYQEKLNDFEYRESRLMNEALKLGAPKTAIGRAVGTANWEILKAKYALTADEFIPTTAQQYVVDKANKMLTINWQEDVSGQRYETPMTLAFVRDDDRWLVPDANWHAVKSYEEWVYGDYVERLMLQPQWSEAIAEAMR